MASPPPLGVPEPPAATRPQPPKPGFTNSLLAESVPSEPPSPVGGGVEGGVPPPAAVIFTSTQWT